MGRHGGGSRSGGFHSSGGFGSHSGSRGSSFRTSTTPFNGCYNRSYVTRTGRRIHCYTNNKSFGTRKEVHVGSIFACILIITHMCHFLSGMSLNIIDWGGKLEGNKECIQVIDNIDLLTPEEETKTLELFEKVYSKSGMPVTLVTEDFDWKDEYTNLEFLSEELYYSMGFDEGCMIILFTAKTEGYFDWEYDMYCGDDTIKCLSDIAFDTLIRKFHKSMSHGNLYEALDYSWNSIMYKLGMPSVNYVGLIELSMFLLLYGIVLIPVIIYIKRQRDAYRYFKENPNELSNEPMTLYSECPSCGAANSFQEEICPYCGTVLKLSDNKVKFVRPDK